MPEGVNSKVAAFQSLYHKGLELLNENKDDEAMAVLYQAAKTAPEGWLALAMELAKDGRTDLAMARLHEVVKLSPIPKVKAAAKNNIGMLLANSGQDEEAMREFKESATLEPAFADTWANIGLLYKWAGNYPEAFRYINEALRRDPWHEEAQFVRAMTYLVDCDYLKGFAEYECRWRSRKNGLKKICTPYPEWNGRNGSNLLCYGEQGAGDAILMLRYAKLISERVKQQWWVAQTPMVGVFKLAGIENVVEIGKPLPDFDVHIPYASLPMIFGTTVDTIPPSPYMQKPDGIVDYGPGFHVGICWRGSKTQSNDMVRSTALKDWLPILNVPGVIFHSLQVGGEEEALLYPQILHEPPPQDWIETARRACGLNLLISVDTGLAHLCGAIGLRCWVATHCRPYFVWPPKCGNNTPWYKSLYLYRQEKPFVWEPLFNQIAADLCQTAKQ